MKYILSRLVYSVLSIVVLAGGAFSTVYATPIVPAQTTFVYTIQNTGDPSEQHVFSIDFSAQGYRVLADNTVEYVPNSYFADYLSGPELGSPPDNPALLENNYAINNNYAEGDYGLLNIGNIFRMESLGSWWQAGTCEFTTAGCTYPERVQEWDVGSYLTPDAFAENYNTYQIISKASPVPLPAGLVFFLSGLAVVAGAVARKRKQG